MLRSLKMTEAEDATTTIVAAEEVLDQEEKETLLQDVKVLEADLEATEILQETVVLEKAVLEVIETLLQKEKVVLEVLLQETKEVQKELLDVRKTLATAQDQEDLEEINTLVSQNIKSQIPDIIGIWDFFILRILRSMTEFCTYKKQDCVLC